MSVSFVPTAAPTPGAILDLLLEPGAGARIIGALTAAGFEVRTKAAARVVGRKPPKGAKHDRCLTHVPHSYPSSGFLCVTTPDPERPAELVAFADYIASVAARKHAEHVARLPGDGLDHTDDMVRWHIPRSNAERAERWAAQHVAGEHTSYVAECHGCKADLAARRAAEDEERTAQRAAELERARAAYA